MEILILIGAFILGYFVFLIAVFVLAQLLFNKKEKEDGDRVVRKTHAWKVQNLRASMPRRVRVKYVMK